MKRNVLLLSVCVLAACLSGCSVAPRLIVAPLDHSRANVGAVYPETERAVTVSVKDARGPGQILGGGMLGPIYLGYVTDKESELTETMQAAATDAARALGWKTGAGSSLDLLIEDFRITMYRFSGFSPMNCVGYGKIQSVLKSPDGTEAKKTFHLTYYEATTPVGSMKEVAREAVSRIYRQAAWEAASKSLAGTAAGEPDPAQLARMVASLDATKDEVARRTTIFWLGILGGNDPAVKQKLLTLFRTSKDQKVHEAAAEAIGMLRIQEAREEIEAALAGTRKVGDWDVSDTEQAWYLLSALGRMGVGDLRSRIPKVDIKMKRVLTDLAQFQETGEMPRVSETEQQELEKARKNILR